VLILGFFVGCVVLGLLIGFFSSNNLNKSLIRGFLDDIIFPALLIIGVLGLFLSLIMVPLNRMNVNAHIKMFQSVEQTAKVARDNNKMCLERAAFQQKVADKNEWLASTKYWNNTICDLWIPDKVKKLEPIG